MCIHFSPYIQPKSNGGISIAAIGFTSIVIRAGFLRGTYLFRVGNHSTTQQQTSTIILFPAYF